MDDSKAQFEEDMKMFVQSCVNIESKSIPIADADTESTQRMSQSSTSSSV